MTPPNTGGTHVDINLSPGSHLLSLSYDSDQVIYNNFGKKLRSLGLARKISFIKFRLFFNYHLNPSTSSSSSSSSSSSRQPCRHLSRFQLEIPIRRLLQQAQVTPRHIPALLQHHSNLHHQLLLLQILDLDMIGEEVF